MAESDYGYCSIIAVLLIKEIKRVLYIHALHRTMRTKDVDLLFSLLLQKLHVQMLNSAQALGARLKDLQVPVPQCHEHEGNGRAQTLRRSDLGHLKTSAWRTTCVVLRGP